MYTSKEGAPPPLHVTAPRNCNIFLRFISTHTAHSECECDMININNNLIDEPEPKYAWNDRSNCIEQMSGRFSVECFSFLWYGRILAGGAVAKIELTDKCPVPPPPTPPRQISIFIFCWLAKYFIYDRPFITYLWLRRIHIFTYMPFCRCICCSIYSIRLCGCDGSKYCSLPVPHGIRIYCSGKYIYSFIHLLQSRLIHSIINAQANRLI